MVLNEYSDEKHKRQAQLFPSNSSNQITTLRNNEQITESEESLEKIASPP